MFYPLMYSSSSNSQKDRVWILRLLSAGLKSFSVTGLLFNCHMSEMVKITFEFIFSLPRIINYLSEGTFGISSVVIIFLECLTM